MINRLKACVIDALWIFLLRWIRCFRGRAEISQIGVPLWLVFAVMAATVMACFITLRNSFIVKPMFKN